MRGRDGSEESDRTLGPADEEQDAWERPQEVTAYHPEQQRPQRSSSGRTGRCTEVTGEQVLLVPTRDSVLLSG